MHRSPEDGPPVDPGAASRAVTDGGGDGGGDPACWLRRVCAACGRLADGDRPTRCPACGADLPDG